MQLVETHVPELILLDQLSPHLDGREVSRWLDARLALRHTPLIAITALAQSGGEGKALDASRDDYLAKPFEPVTFRANIREHTS
jgi:putative two-component system response regulator